MIIPTTITSACAAGAFVAVLQWMKWREQEEESCEKEQENTDGEEQDENNT